MKKRVLSVLLSIVMVVGLFPMTAWASETAYGITVGGTAVTSDNASDVLGDGGTVTYAPNTNTLTLNSAAITGAAHGITFTEGTLNVVAADSTITLSGSSYYGIYVPSGCTLNFSGTGTLTVKNSSAAYGIYNAGGTVNFSGKLAAQSTGSSQTYGVYVTNSGTVNITDGSVSATGTSYYLACGIYVSSGTANISGGSVSATCTGEDAYGVYTLSSAKACISGGTISGTYIGSGYDYGYGVYNEGNTYLSGSPAISGSTAAVYQSAVGNSSKSLYANDGNTEAPAYYTGSPLTVKCSTSSSYYGKAVVCGVSSNHTENSPLFTLTSANHYLELSDGDLILHGNPVTLTWMDGEDTLTGNDHPTSAEYGQSITLPTLTKENYIFLGWTLPDDDTVYKGSKSFTSETTLTAAWMEDFSGSGMVEAPYEISTVADLQKLQMLVNGGHEAYNNSSVYYKLTANIDLSLVCSAQLGSWTPIGNSSYKFAAHFDGNSKTISNLYINKNSSYQGLFGCLATGSEVTNLVLTGQVSASDYFGPLGYGYGGDTDENGNNTAGVTLSPYDYTSNGSMAYIKKNNNEPFRYDIKGIYNGNWVKTTFSDRGYYVTASDLNGASVVGNVSFINGGRYVKVAYTVTAGEEPVSEGKLGIYADTMIADNDYAAIEVIKDGDAVIGLKMVDTGVHGNYAENDPCFFQNAQFSLYFRDAYGVTDADTYWFGHYSYSDVYVFQQLNGSDSSTYPSNNSSGYNTEFTSYSNYDSGLAFSWQNIELAPGESKTFSFIVGIGEKVDPPTFDSTSPLAFDVSSYAVEKKITVTATVTDAAGQTDSLYYDINGGGETLLGSVAADGTAKTIEKDIDLTSLADGVYTFHFWLLNTGGATSGVVERTVIISNGSITVGETGQYAVSYDMQGHGTAPAALFVAGDSKLTAPAAPTADGYTFGGWYKNAACTNAWAFATDTVTENTVLYAKWTANTYTVTYAPGTNGTGNETTATKTHGTDLTLADAIFTRTDYTQTGWATEDGGTQAYALGASYTDDAPVTLYPVWTINQYTITYELNGGTVDGTNPTEYTIESIAITLINPTRTGYTFGGWTGTGLDAATMTVTIPTGSTENREYTATWTPAALTGTVTISGTLQVGQTLTATVSGDNNTGALSYQWCRAAESNSSIDGATDSTYTITAGDVGYKIYCVVSSSIQTGTVTSAATAAIAKLNAPAAPTGLTVSAPSAPAANDGKITGVSTDMEYSTDGINWTPCTGTEITGLGSGSYYVRVAETGDTDAGASVTIVVPAVYTVTFDANGGSGTMADMIFTYGTGQALTTNAFKQEGHSFVGWATTMDGSAVYTDGQVVQNLTAENNAIVTLYAVWSENPVISGTITGQNGVTYDSVTAELVGLNGQKYAVVIADPTGTDPKVYGYIGTAPKGEYNLVVTAVDTYENTVTVTTHEDLSGDMTENVALPSGQKNSIVRIMDGDTPNVIVGGLDEIASDGAPEKVITVTLTVEGKEDVTGSSEQGQDALKAEQTSIKSKAGGKSLKFIDLTLTKVENEVPVENFGSDNTVVLEIVVPFQTSGRTNITVYRHHNGGETLTKLNTRPASDYTDGTYFVGDNFVVIYAKKFSTYAIGYTVPTSGGSSTPTYAITVEKTENGTIKANRTYASYGSTVTITAEPEDGYVLSGLTVTDSQGNKIEATDKGDGTYTFKMPSRKVTVKAVFTMSGGYSICPGDSSCPIDPFTDASPSAWYHDGVHYCIDNGLMSGYGNNIFKPDADTTRAMITVMLWRLEGSPVVNYLLDFEDVEEGKWYTEAVRWAKSEGIAAGYGNGYFGTNDPITREQMVTILWRYAQHKGYDVSVGEDTNILSFDDAFDVSEYAIPAMQWACGSGMVVGKNDPDGEGMILDPEGKGTRAQIATMMMRFCDEILK